VASTFKPVIARSALGATWQSRSVTFEQSEHLSGAAKSMFAMLIVYNSGLLRRKNLLLAMTESSVVSSLQSLSARLPHQIKAASPNFHVFIEKWNKRKSRKIRCLLYMFK
jgi:hypothetical protein